MNKDNKFTSLGLSYTEKEKQERKEAEWIARMDMEINDTVDGLLPSSSKIFKTDIDAFDAKTVWRVIELKERELVLMFKN